MKTITKDIIGYEGLYKITNKGKVIRMPREKKTNGGGSVLLPKIDVTINYNTNYPTVVLMKDGKQKTFFMHRLIAIHFIDNDNPMKREVNHKNKNIVDFSVNNLEWCTRSENMKHAKKKINIYLQKIRTI